MRPITGYNGQLSSKRKFLLPALLRSTLLLPSKYVASHCLSYSANSTSIVNL